MFIQITQVWVHYFKSFNRVQSSQDEKARFIKGNELKLTQVELFSFLFFKRVIVVDRSIFNPTSIRLDGWGDGCQDKNNHSSEKFESSFSKVKSFGERATKRNSLRLA